LAMGGLEGRGPARLTRPDRDPVGTCRSGHGLALTDSDSESVRVRSRRGTGRPQREGAQGRAARARMMRLCTRALRGAGVRRGERPCRVRAPRSAVCSERTRRGGCGPRRRRQGISLWSGPGPGTKLAVAACCGPLRPVAARCGGNAARFDLLRPVAARCGPLRRQCGPLRRQCGPLRPVAARCDLLRPVAARCGPLRPVVTRCGPLRPVSA
jgi:hypothetical protein